MSWRRKSPGHQQPWYCPSSPRIFWFQHQKYQMIAYNARNIFDWAFRVTFQNPLKSHHFLVLLFKCSKAGTISDIIWEFKSLIIVPLDHSHTVYSLISSHFNYCHFFSFFTHIASIQLVSIHSDLSLQNCIQTMFFTSSSIKSLQNCIQTMFFYKLLHKTIVDCFRISSLKKMVFEIYKIVNGFVLNYLSSSYEMFPNPYKMCHKSRFLQPKVNPTTVSIEIIRVKIQNLVLLNIKLAVFLPQSKNQLIKWLSTTHKCTL